MSLDPGVRALRVQQQQQPFPPGQVPGEAVQVRARSPSVMPPARRGHRGWCRGGSARRPSRPASRPTPSASPAAPVPRERVLQRGDRRIVAPGPVPGHSLPRSPTPPRRVGRPPRAGRPRRRRTPQRRRRLPAAGPGPRPALGSRPLCRPRRFARSGTPRASADAPGWCSSAWAMRQCSRRRRAADRPSSTVSRIRSWVNRYPVRPVLGQQPGLQRRFHRLQYLLVGHCW